jgi:pathogenesis-related protein 1
MKLPGLIEKLLCGHYTQVVWKNSMEVGGGMAICDNKSQVWVCNYNPPGNVEGEKPY